MPFAGVEQQRAVHCARPAGNRFPILSVLLGGILAASGCATTSGSTPQIATAANAQRFSMVGAGFETYAAISPDGAQGPKVNLGRYDNGKAIRGTVYGQTLDLTVSDDKASGIWGPGPISVNLVPSSPEELKVQGLIAGRPSNFTATKQRIQGTIGFCAYDLGRSGEDYVGSRSCAAGISSVTVEFPPHIGTWKPINIAVLMALLMSAP
jgi:hypothetical protein